MPVNPKRKKVLLIGGIAVGGGALFILYRKMKGGSTAGTTTAATDTSGIDPNTGVPYSQEGVDPNTGIPYADESGYGLGGIGSPYGGYGGYSFGPTGTIAPTTNAEWAVAAENQLAQDGFDPGTVAIALGLYLGGQALTANQYQIVQAAIGMEGQPPNAVAPPHQGPQPVPAGGGNLKAGNVTVPSVTGKNVINAYAILAGKGLIAKTQRGLKYNPTKKYVVASQSPSAGAKVSRGSAVSMDIHLA